MIIYVDVIKTNEMKLFRWLDGRQHGVAYKKWCFLYFKFFNLGIDGYILKYEPKTALPIHKDTINGSHYRLNISLCGRSEFWCPSCIFRKGRCIFFRPDLFYHALTVYTKTYKISFGLAIFKSKL